MMKTNNFLSKVCAVLIVLFITNNLTGQEIQFNYIGGGEYSAESEFPDDHLHFYLFGDGHHSFDSNPNHTYKKYTSEIIPRVFYTKPYGPVDPEEDEFSPVVEGDQQAVVDPYTLKNKIQLQRSWNFVEENDNYILLMFENVEDTKPISGCVEFHFSSDDVNIIEEDILDEYPNNWVNFISLSPSDYQDLGYEFKYSWSFTDLEYLEQRFVYIPTWCLRPSSTKISNMGVMKTNGCQATPPYSSKKDGSSNSNGKNTFYTLKSLVANSPHDPNCIVTETQCLSTLDVKQTVEYRIYFQNEGIDPAADITVNLRNNVVPFDQRLLSYDVTLLQASHNCILTLDPEHKSSVIFEDIQLPGTKMDPPPIEYDQTIGWVDLEFCYDLSKMTELHLNNLDFFVDIIFDSEAPVEAHNNLIRRNPNCGGSQLSNDSCSEILVAYQSFQVLQHLNKPVTGRQLDQDTKLDFKLLPNPATDHINFDLVSGAIHEDYKIRIFDSRQKLCKAFKYESIAKHEIDISDLPPNVYLFVLTGPDIYQVKKFIKI